MNTFFDYDLFYDKDCLISYARWNEMLRQMKCTYSNSHEVSLGVLFAASMWLREVKVPKFVLRDMNGVLQISLSPDFKWTDITKTEFKYIVAYWFGAHQAGICKGVYIYGSRGPLFIYTDPVEDLFETYRGHNILQDQELAD